MSKTNTGGSAFPRAGNEWEDMQWVKASAKEGMTLRDYFAAKAMPIFTPDYLDPDDHESMFECATQAYSMADAMLRARGRK